MARAAVCLLARDCAEHLKNTFKQLDRLSQQFSELRIFFVENNSSDQTRMLIKAYAASHSNVIIDCFDDASLDSLHRIKKMALLRSRAITLVKNSYDMDPDYLLIVDPDVDFEVKNILKIIKNAPHDWVSLSANGQYYLQIGSLRIPVLYYDLFAYVPENSNTIMFSENEMLDNRFCLHRAFLKQRYVPCQSAFGGMAIYRYVAIKNNNYTLEKNTQTNDFEYLCEHIPFTLRLAEFGRCYICREMKVLYEPVAFDLYIMRLTREIKRLLKIVFTCE